MHRPLRSAFLLGVLAGLVLALLRALRQDGRPAPAPLSAPATPIAPPAPAPVRIPEPAAWAEPVEGACPDGYPIKAKASSGIYHRPGGLSYERTRPDRCYRDEAAAEADGYRAAKR